MSNPYSKGKSMQQIASCIWFTGLSGSGKSILSKALAGRLLDLSYNAYVLDGDALRCGLNKDLSMSESDRSENVRRAGEVARLMFDAGIIVICAFISPYEKDRKRVKALFPPERFVEIYLKTDLTVCEARDPKGLYKKVRRGEIKDFTGIDAPYEAPSNADIVIDTAELSLEPSIKAIMDFLSSKNLVDFSKI